jgi:hypothetical protein
MMDTVQRIAVAAALCTVMLAAGIEWDHWAFVCVIVLFGVSNYLATRHGVELGVATGIEMMTVMTEAQRNDVMNLVRQAQREEENE